jgi:hypothetical protein
MQHRAAAARGLTFVSLPELLGGETEEGEQHASEVSGGEGTLLRTRIIENSRIVAGCESKFKLACPSWIFIIDLRRVFGSAIELAEARPLA